MTDTYQKIETSGSVHRAFSGNAAQNAISRPALSVLQKKNSEEEELQMKLANVAGDISQRKQNIAPPKANRTGMSDYLKSGIENLSGYSMDDVRVHFNSSLPSQLNALAYAQGSDIHIAPGQERHLPHEAWHVVQQKQGRVRPTMQMREVAINDDRGLEKEADVMGDKMMRSGEQSFHLKPVHLLTGEAVQHIPYPVVQPKLGFELELLVLVDVDGRPVPEKRFLGSYGTQNLELQVDHNGSVEGTTPRPPAEANFQVARNLPLGGGGGINWQQLGTYDLPATHETTVGVAPGGAPVVDPRTGGLNFNLLNPVNWQNSTNGNRYLRPPAVNSTGTDNTAFGVIDQLILQYIREKDNWEAARAGVVLFNITQSINSWLANNLAPSYAHPIRRSRYFTVRNTLLQLRQEVLQHRQFWTNPANQQAPPGINRLYRRAAGGGVAAGAWSVNHPIAGQGTDRYASILEIVTRPYEPERPAQAANLIVAMTEAAALAQAIENGTANFANRILFNTIPNTNILNPLTYIGNSGPTLNPQSTDASIQSTFAVDLAQIPSLIKSTVAFGAPQNQFSLKHQADVGGTPQNPGGINRAEVEMAIAVANATNVIRDVKAQIGGGVGPIPSFVNLRGLVTLICQYLRLGKHWTGPGVQSLDKNLTDLLSRTDLSQIFGRAVPATEKNWIQANPANLTFLINRMFHYTNRNQVSALLNNPTETRAPGGPAQFAITCQQFVNNVFTQASDGVTPHFGGFQQRPTEDIDPLGNRGGDTRPVGTAHREAPVFEMRNMIPKLGGAERFPRTDWITMTQYMIDLIRLLNARAEAHATQDIRVFEHLGGLGNPAGLGNPENPW